MTMISSYKQFFTPQKYSQYLINELKHLAPKRVIDLAIGAGSLLEEAILQWPNAKYFGNDIDQVCCDQICDEYSEIKCFNHDIFKYSTIDILFAETQPIDLCLGNPPFDLIQQDEDTKKVLKIFNLDTLYSTNKIPAEVIFILQCLRIVSKDGIIALILPNGFFVNTFLKKFREFLLNNYYIEKVIDLPERIFNNTDAKTHILILHNKPVENTYITLTSVTNTKKINISHTEAIHRMDYNYYFHATQRQTNTSIADLDVMIFRGKAKYQLTDVSPQHILHTTNFSKGNEFSNRLHSAKRLFKYQDRLAVPGDIILSRVGSHSIGNVGIVNKGFFVATDCVFVIRVKDIILRKQIFTQLRSSEGNTWIKANAKGVAAQHITLEDIKKFPILKEEYEFITT